MTSSGLHLENVRRGAKLEYQKIWGARAFMTVCISYAVKRKFLCNRLARCTIWGK